MKEIKDKTPEQKLREVRAAFNSLKKIDYYEYKNRMDVLNSLEGQPSSTIAKVLKSEFLIS